MIREIIVTTGNADGSTHIAPMGVREEGGLIVIAPFVPSLTLDNIQRSKTAVINCVDDVRLFAGCLTGRRDWPLAPAERIEGQHLQAALSHLELRLERFEDEAVRPRLYCEVVHEVIHRPFRGFNRAQAVVLEAAILTSRLHLLEDEKIDREINYLNIALEKTAGENERLAWQWLMEKIRIFRMEKQKEK